MKIWIDLTNSPHVLFFEPIIKELKEKGYEVVITARDYQQTIQLLEEKNIDFIKLGKPITKKMGILSKIIGGLLEIYPKIKFINEHKPDLTISHQAFYSTIASWITRKKSLYIFDGDKAFLQMLGIYFGTKILCPEKLPEKMKGINPLRYQGIKEEVYLWDFKPDKDYLEKLGIKKKNYNILIRPEATTASYIKEEVVLETFFKELEKEKDIQVIIIPRTPEQKKYYEEFHKSFFIPSKVVDGPNLIANVDLVLSGGGTMNREAVALGIPVISFFPNEPLSIDKWLIEEGYMKLIKTPSIDDIKKLKLGKNYVSSNNGREKIIKIIEGMVENDK